MKAGTLIFLIVVILIAFGFVLSDGLQTRQEARELKNKIEELNAQLTRMQTQLGTCQDQSLKDRQTITGLQGQVDALEAERGALKDQIAALTMEIAFLKAQQSFLDLLTENPVLLTGALLTQFAASAMKFSKKLGIQWPGTTSPGVSNEYVKLSREEREGIISARRSRKDKRA